MAIIDQQYLDAIKAFEGFTPQAKWDYRQDSNGYGTKALYPGEVIDQPTAEQRFQAEIEKAAAHVDTVAKDAPPGVRAALTSLTYNAGPGWINAGLGDLVRAGDYQGAAQRLQEYNKAGGQVLPGLQSRRAQEAAWFNGLPGTQMAAASPQAPQMPAYAWSPGATQGPQNPNGAMPAVPSAPSASQSGAPALSFEQLGKVLGLEDPPPLQPPQVAQVRRFAKAPSSGPFSFHRT